MSEFPFERLILIASILLLFYYYLLSFPRVWTFVQCQLPYHHFLCTITITIKVLACSINSTVLRALGATCWPQIADQRGPHWKLSRNHHRAINRSDLDRQIEPNGARPSETGVQGGPRGNDEVTMGRRWSDDGLTIGRRWNDDG